ncbi:Protein of unknown function [Marinobacter antarcticus]|uniref:Lipoprotein n=1 Tax=Marinobacter antarcticus TaxID=564117 RepID=A0A1M6UE97_9GAMM|nr:DUF1499 domain-containing protein [Marinobacter antarcticus]SHK67500.1 Protein of unknown function [Marinobacter antarcticus]
MRYFVAVSILLLAGCASTGNMSPSGTQFKHLDLRSQSLVGLYDLGVNRRRIELLRSRLIERGIAVD